MLKEDFKDEDIMRMHSESLYEKLRQSRRLLLKINTRLQESDRIYFKGCVQWLNSALDQLTFEKNKDE
tara:strand:- start:5665 stop:5868 length:204 start_codon:yes stop_codon:yes gene_type:complete